MTGNPLRGASYLLRGFSFIFKPSIRRYVMMPLSINIVLFIGLIFLGINQFETLLAWLMPDLPNWLQWLKWPLWMFFSISTLVLIFYTFSIIANIVSSPFNGPLAAAVEREINPNITTTQSQENTQLSIMRDILVSIKHEVEKLLYMVFCFFPALILFFIPVVNIAAPVVWFLLGAWLLALEYADYPMSNHGINFKDTKKKLRQKGGTSMGFGAITMGATIIPGINLIVIPAAVAGATIMWVENFSENND
ncbi:Sulfate transporter, CysZ-type [hydrothermal vent metagenome]|uniref:Sulfate transporter, CysZ-type n=1 Tax=hydrothermal vent metagenome TaxID=652676 RepID=A0A3B1A056_9ZZZZ